LKKKREKKRQRIPESCHTICAELKAE
jgi:hypothetical protein